MCFNPLRRVTFFLKRVPGKSHIAGNKSYFGEEKKSSEGKNLFLSQEGGNFRLDWLGRSNNNISTSFLKISRLGEVCVRIGRIWFSRKNSAAM